MTAHEIARAIAGIDQTIRATALAEVNDHDRALIALRDLLVAFLQTTAGPGNHGGGFMRDLSIEQVRLINQLHVAVGL